MTDQQKALEQIEADEKRLNEQLVETAKKKTALKAEIAKDLIADIKAKVKMYDITQEQIFGPLDISQKPKIKNVKSRTKTTPDKPTEFLYQSAKGEGWTGGRGRVPDWVKAVKDGGGDIEKYRIQK